MPATDSPVARNWDAELAPLYTELGHAQQSGDAARAKLLYDALAALLGEALRTSYALGCAHWAERRDREAFSQLDTVLGLYRWALPGFEPPVSRAACYRALGEIYAAWGQPAAVAAAMALALRGGRSFYGRPHLCQIPVLEAFYEQLFGQSRDGSFVEVGAFDGETYGNTAGLADLGWAGLYIEPVPAAAEQCRRRHAGNPRVTLLNCAIGADDGTARLWVAREFSTVSPAHVERSIASGWMSEGAYQPIDVPQLRLETALVQAGVAPGFDLLVVDVEGAEEQVFAGFDLGAWRPRALIVELCDFSPDPAAAGAPGSDAVAAARGVRETIGASGYAAVYADFTNTIFRRADG